MSVDETLAELKDLREQMNAAMTQLREEMRVQGETYFEKIAKALFKEYPLMAGFAWTQYTPYFNDGEECLFSVYGDDAVIRTYRGEVNECPTCQSVLEGETDELAELEDDESSGYGYYSDNDWRRKAQSQVGTLLRSIDEDVLKALFGDHAFITVTQKGVTVDVYNHD